MSNHRSRYYRRKEKGLCTKCGSEATKGIFCYKHWIWNLYNNIYNRCGNKQNNPKSETYENIELKFSRDEFLDWANKNKPTNFENPSIDRINDDKDYTIENIQWMNLGKNSSKGRGTQYNIPEGKWKCYNCGEIKNLNTDNFWRNSAHSNGFHNKCKECCNS